MLTLLRFTKPFLLISILLVTATVHAVYDKNSANMMYVPGQLIVKYKNTDSIKLLNQEKKRITSRSAINRNIGMHLISSPDENILDLITELKNDPNVDFVERNYIDRSTIDSNDPIAPQQYQLDSMELKTAWNTISDASSITLAVIDDGFDLDHEDLQANFLNSGACFESSSGTCNAVGTAASTSADENHGTLVSGSAGAVGNNNIGVSGAAWSVGILPIKFDFTTAASAEAITYAVDQGADIINLSFGGPVNSRARLESLEYARDRGVLVITSAGNSDTNIDWSKASQPANAPLDNVIAVAASTEFDTVTTFSEWGATTVDTAAPGFAVLTTNNDNDYRAVNGTSFSSPLVAGVAALVKAHTGADYKELRARLLNASEITDTSIRTNTLHGRTATGALNAAKALQAPTTGVLVLDNISFDDSQSGNANNAIDANETLNISIDLKNLWTDATNVTGTLSTDSPLVTIDTAQQSFGTIARDTISTANFPVTVGNVSGHNYALFKLELSSDTGAHATRYFYQYISKLENGVTLTQSIQESGWDEYHYYHIDVPTGASNLRINTSSQNSTDIDLLVKFGSPPEHNISLDPPEGETGFFFADAQTLISGAVDGEEEIVIAQPQAGTYHIVVVNFAQIQHDYTVTASFDEPDAGIVQFTAGSYQTSEDNTAIEIPVTRSGGVGQVTIDITSANGTATANNDFTEVTTTLTWNDGETGNKTVSVPIINDDVIETEESFTLNLSNPTGELGLGTTTSTTVTIADNDAPGEFNITSPTDVNIEENSSNPITVSLSRSGGSKGVVSVDYSTNAGTATGDVDFSATSGTLTWADGETGEKTINISVINDQLIEDDEAFSLNLSNPQGTIINGSAIVNISIQDDDSAGSLNFSASNYQVNENASTITIAVQRIGGSIGPATIDYTTSNGTATEGQDYTASSGTLAWTDADSADKTFTVSISDDSLDEANETINITLSNINSAELGSPSSATITITDNDAAPPPSSGGGGGGGGSMSILLLILGLIRLRIQFINNN